MKIKELYINFKAAERENTKIEMSIERDYESGAITEQEAFERENEAIEHYDNVFYPAYSALIEEVMRMTGLDRAGAKITINSKKFEALMARI